MSQEILENFLFDGGELISVRRGPYTRHYQVFRLKDGRINIASSVTEQNRPALLDEDYFFFGDVQLGAREVSSIEEAESLVRREI